MNGHGIDNCRLRDQSLLQVASQSSETYSVLLSRGLSTQYIPFCASSPFPPRSSTSRTAPCIRLCKLLYLILWLAFSSLLSHPPASPLLLSPAVRSAPSPSHISNYRYLHFLHFILVSFSLHDTTSILLLLSRNASYRQPSVVQRHSTPRRNR